VITPAFPAQWFTAYSVLSPVNQRLPASSARCVSIVADLAPAWARQDHTTPPSASMPYVFRHQPVHRIPLHFRDDAYAPRAGAEREEQIIISEKANDLYFWLEGWTNGVGLKNG
jgi:hypothetical protein